MPPERHHDLVGHLLDAGRDVELALRQARLALTRRTPEEAVELFARHAQAVEEIEVADVEPEAAILAPLHHLAHLIVVDPAAP